MDDLTPEEEEAVSQAMEGTPAEGNGSTEPVQEEAAVATQEAPMETASAEAAPITANSGTVSRAQFMQLEELAEAANLPPAELKRVHDVKVNVEVLLGTTRMPLEEVLALQAGSLVELNKLAGEPVEVLANEQPIARAEVVVIEDSFGIKILEIIGNEKKLEVFDQ